MICSEINPGLSISYGEKRTAINKALLGQYHSLHKSDGTIVDEVFWYEEHERVVTPPSLTQEKIDSITAKIIWFRERYSECTYRVLLKRALVRWVNAFDSLNYNSAIVDAWGALESLLSVHGEQHNDNVPRRCSRLYEDHQYVRQVIEHIREYRNGNVHRGETSEEPKTICYQLQRYFLGTIFFLLRNSKEFRSQHEALEFLDLPLTADQLERQKELIEKAQKFFFPKETEST